ncbi:MAG: MlaD family protein [Burkholderiaceae bacterium]|nr:MlaD family protein [Burkholderiaceae bacterium]
MSRHVPFGGAAPPLARKAWLLAMPALLALATWFLYTASQQGMLSSKERIHFLAPTAAGMTPGMPVKLNGFIVGAVERIALLPPSVQSNLRVRVELGIYRNYMSYVPRTTIARLTQEGMLGPNVIELHPQRYDARPVSAGDVLAYERTPGLAEIATHLQEKLAPVLDHATTLGANLNDPQGKFQGAISAATSAMERLPTTAERLEETARRAGDDLRKLEGRTERSLDKTDHALDAVNSKLPGLLDKADKTVADLQAAGASVRRITGDTEQAAPGLLQDAQHISADGTRLMQGATTSWPMRLWLPPPQPRGVAVDSQQDLPLPPLPPARERK